MWYLLRKTHGYHVLTLFESISSGRWKFAFRKKKSYESNRDQHPYNENIKSTMSSTTGPEESHAACSNVAFSFEKSVKAADSTLKQLSTAKETFSDFEAFYKKFVIELNNVKDEHRLELQKFHTAIENTEKSKRNLESQLCDARAEIKKHKTELSSLRRLHAEIEWKNEKLNRELSTNKFAIEKLKMEKAALEEEMELLRKKIAEKNILALKATTKDGDVDELDIVRKEAEELDRRYKQALQEKEDLHEDIVLLQKRLADLQTDFKKNQDECQTQTQNANIKIYKAEMQLKNITRQKEMLKKQNDDNQDELKTCKEKYTALERVLAEEKQTSSNYHDEIIIKTQQIATLQEFNQTLENKMDTMQKEYIPQEVSIETFSSQDLEQSFDLQLLQSKVEELKESLKATNSAKDKLEREGLVAQSQIMELQDDNHRSQEKIQQLENKLSTTRVTASALESELSMSKNKMSYLETESNDLKDELQELMSKLDTANQRSYEVQSLCDQALAERDESKEKVMFADRKVAEMKEIVRHDEEINNELEEKLASMKNQFLKMEGQQESNLKQIERLKEELGTERFQKSNAQQDLFAVQNKLNEVQKISDRSKRDSELNQTLIVELKRSITSKDKKIETFYEDFGKLQAKLEVLEEENRDLHQEALTAQNKIKELENDYNMVKQEKDRLDMEIQNAYDNTNKLQCKLNVSEQDKHDTQQQVTLLQNKVNKSDSELDETMKQSVLLEAKLQDALTSLTKKNEDIATFQSQLGESQRMLEVKEQDLNKKELLLEQLREKIARQIAHTESIQDEHENTKAFLESSENENKKLTEQLQLKADDLFRVNALNEKNAKRKKQLEGELEEVRLKLSSAESNRKITEQNARKELEFEQDQTLELQRKLEHYKSKLASLQTQTDSSVREMVVVKEDLAVANEKIAHLTQDLEKSVDEKTENNQKVTALENKIGDMEREVASAKSLKENADNDLSTANTKIVKLESTIETLSKQRNNLKEQLNTANEEVLSYKEEMMRFENKVSEQKKTNDALNHVINMNDHVVEDLRQKMRDYDAKLVNQQQELKSQEIIVESFKTEKFSFEKRCSSYQEKMTTNENELLKAREAKLKLEQEFSVQKLQVNDYESQVVNLKKEKDHYKKEFENSLSNARKAKQEHLKNQNRIVDLQRSLESNSANMKGKDRVIARLRESNVLVETENEALKADVEGLLRNVKHKEEIVQNFENTLEASACDSLFETTLSNAPEENELEKKTQEIKALETQALERENSIKVMLQEHKTKLSNIESELKTAKQQNVEMTENFTSLNRKHDNLETINRKLENEKKEIKEQFMCTNVRMSDLEVKYDFECEQKKSLENQFDDSQRKINEALAQYCKLEHENTEKQLAIELADKKLQDKDKEISNLSECKNLLEEQNEKLRATLKQNREESEKKRLQHVLLQEELMTLRSSLSNGESQLLRGKFDQQHLQEKCKSYITKVSTLEQRIAELNKQKGHLNQTIESLKDSLENKQRKETDSEKKRIEFKREAEKMSLEISRKNEKIQELQDSITAMEKMFTMSKQSISDLERDCTSLTVKKSYMELELRKAKAKEKIADGKAVSPVKQTPEEEISLTKKKMAELEKNYENMVDKEKELQGQLTAANAEASKWQNLYNTTNAKKIELEDELTSLQREHGPMKEVCKEAMNQVEIINFKLQKVSKRNVVLEEDLSKMKSQRQQLQNEVNEKALKLKLVESEARKSTISVDSPSKTTELLPDGKKLQDQTSLLRQEILDLQISLSRTSKARDDAERQLFEMKSKENDVSTKLKCCQDENEQLMNELQTYRHKLCSVEEQLHTSISEHSTTRTSKEEANKKFIVCNEEKNNLQEKLNSLKYVADLYTSENAEKNDELEKCRTKMDSYVKEISLLKYNVASMKTNHAKLEKEVVELKQEMHEKNKMVSRMENALKGRKKTDPIVYKTWDTVETESNCLENENNLKTSDRELNNKIVELKTENEKLKVEISHLQATQALLEIQKATYKNFENNNNLETLNDDKIIKEKAEEESQPVASGLEILAEQYSIVIEEMMELSRQLQDDHLNVSEHEWNAHHDQIIICNERLQSTFVALESLFVDLNRSFEKEPEEERGYDTQRKSRKYLPSEKKQLDKVDGAKGSHCNDEPVGKHSIGDVKTKEFLHDKSTVGKYPNYSKERNSGIPVNEGYIEKTEKSTLKSGFLLDDIFCFLGDEASIDASYATGFPRYSKERYSGIPVSEECIEKTEKNTLKAGILPEDFFCVLGDETPIENNEITVKTVHENEPGAFLSEDNSKADDSWEITCSPATKLPNYSKERYSGLPVSEEYIQKTKKSSLKTGFLLDDIFCVLGDEASIENNESTVKTVSSKADDSWEESSSPATKHLTPNYSRERNNGKPVYEEYIKKTEKNSLKAGISPDVYNVENIFCLLDDENATKNDEIQSKSSNESAKIQNINVADLDLEKEDLIRQKNKTEQELLNAKEMIKKLETRLQEDQQERGSECSKKGSRHLSSQDKTIFTKETLSSQYETMFTKETFSSRDETSSTLSTQFLEQIKEENHELRLQVDMLKMTSGQANALIAELRVMISRLRKELESYKNLGSISGSRNRYNSMNRSRENIHKEPTTSSWRRSTPKPNRTLASDQESVTSDIIFSNEDNLLIKEREHTVTKESVSPDDSVTVNDDVSLESFFDEGSLSPVNNVPLKSDINFSNEDISLIKERQHSVTTERVSLNESVSVSDDISLESVFSEGSLSSVNNVPLKSDIKFSNEDISLTKKREHSVTTESVSLHDSNALSEDLSFKAVFGEESLSSKHLLKKSQKLAEKHITTIQGHNLKKTVNYVVHGKKKSQTSDEQHSTTNKNYMETTVSHAENEKRNSSYDETFSNNSSLNETDASNDLESSKESISDQVDGTKDYNSNRRRSSSQLSFALQNVWQTSTSYRSGQVSYTTKSASLSRRNSFTKKFY